MLSFSFKRQLNQIFKEACSKALGETPHSILHLCSKKPKNNSLHYEVGLAKQIYETYREDGFKYSDHGTTPKSLAEELEVHLPSKGITWEIDHFGHFIVRPSQAYLQELINPPNSSLFLPLSGAGQNKEKRGHVFHFYVDSLTDVDDLRRLVEMERKARVISLLNSENVLRIVYFNKKQGQGCAKLFIELFLHPQSQLQIKPFSGLPSAEKQANQQNIHYFSCCPSNVLYYENNLPGFRLITHYLGRHDNTPIASLPAEQLQSRVALKHQWASSSIQKKLQADWEYHEYVLELGDLLDEHRFGDALYLRDMLAQKTELSLAKIDEVLRKINVLP